MTPTEIRAQRNCAIVRRLLRRRQPELARELNTLVRHWRCGPGCTAGHGRRNP